VRDVTLVGDVTHVNPIKNDFITNLSELGVYSVFTAFSLSLFFGVKNCCVYVDRIMRVDLYMEDTRIVPQMAQNISLGTVFHIYFEVNVENSIK
jgi:hypothetical protein